MVSYNLFAHTPLVVFSSESATVTDSIRRRSQKRARELSERGKSYASLEIDFGARVVQRPQLPKTRMDDGWWPSPSWRECGYDKP